MRACDAVYTVKTLWVSPVSLILLYENSFWVCLSCGTIIKQCGRQHHNRNLLSFYPFETIQSFSSTPSLILSARLGNSLVGHEQTGRSLAAFAGRKRVVDVLIRRRRGRRGAGAGAGAGTETGGLVARDGIEAALFVLSGGDSADCRRLGQRGSLFSGGVGLEDLLVLGQGPVDADRDAYGSVAVASDLLCLDGWHTLHRQWLRVGEQATGADRGWLLGRGGKSTLCGGVGGVGGGGGSGGRSEACSGLGGFARLVLAVWLGDRRRGTPLLGQGLSLVTQVLKCALVSKLLHRRLDDLGTSAKFILKALWSDVDLCWWLSGDGHGLLALDSQLTSLISRLLHSVPGAAGLRAAGAWSTLDTGLDERARISQQGRLLLGLLVVELHGASSKRGSILAESED